MRPLSRSILGIALATSLCGLAKAQVRPAHGLSGGFAHGSARSARGPFAGPTAERYAPPGFNNRFRPGQDSLGADWREQQDEARQGVRRGRLAPLGRVIEGIGRHSPGRQLDTGIEYLGDRPVYRVRWVTDHGRRVDYIVDAATGAILGER